MTDVVVGVRERLGRDLGPDFLGQRGERGQDRIRWTVPQQLGDLRAAGGTAASGGGGQHRGEVFSRLADRAKEHRTRVCGQEASPDFEQLRRGLHRRSGEHADARESVLFGEALVLDGSVSALRLLAGVADPKQGHGEAVCAAAGAAVERLRARRQVREGPR